MAIEPLLPNTGCKCPDWKPNIEAINGPIVLQTIRSGHSYQYRGKPFVYCPWCASKLGDGTIQAGTTVRLIGQLAGAFTGMPVDGWVVETIDEPRYLKYRIRHSNGGLLDVRADSIAASPAPTGSPQS